MTHDPHARYDAYGMLAQMRSLLAEYDAERRKMDDLNIFMGVMLRTLEELWDVIRSSDIHRPRVRPHTRYHAQACAALIGDLCRQPDWDMARQPEGLDIYYDTLRSLHWLLQVTHAEWCPVSDEIGDTCTCLADREI